LSTVVSAPGRLQNGSATADRTRRRPGA